MLEHDPLARFARGLKATGEVVLEAVGNTAAIVEAIRPHVATVVIANPLQVRLIAEARVKTDKIDAAILAQLYASGFLPQVWMPDDRSQALRRQVARRTQLVRDRTRLKNQVQAVLAAQLIPRCPATDLFGRKGRVWLAQQPLPLDERMAVEQRLCELDRLGDRVPRVLLNCAGILGSAQAAKRGTDGRVPRMHSRARSRSTWVIVSTARLQPRRHCPAGPPTRPRREASQQSRCR